MGHYSVLLLQSLCLHRSHAERWLSRIKSGKIGFWLANSTCSVFPEKLPKDTRTPLRRNIVKEFIEQAIHKLLSRVRKPRGKL